jgi:hypothetical protein
MTTDPFLGEYVSQVHESSTLHQSIYYPGLELLTLIFKRGGTYSYRPVPLALHKELIQSESAGKAFAALIKNNPAIECCRGTAAEYPL